MLRIVIKTDNSGMACNVGGSVHSTLNTFDVNLPEIEAFLHEELDKYHIRQIIGVEIRTELVKEEVR